MESKPNQNSIKKTLIFELISEQSLSSENSTLTQNLLESNSHQIQTKSETEPLDADCQTPKELIFDPFRPGPDELAFAPKRKLYRRQLNYDISLFPISNLNSEFDDLAKNEDEKSVEVFCKSFIDLIITKVVDDYCNEGFETPKKLGFRKGFEETCPPAPLRVDLKSERFDKKSLCRNLELEFDLV